MTKPVEIELHVAHFGNGTGARGHIDEVVEARKVTKRVYEILQSMRVPSTFFEDKVSKNRNDNIGRLVKHHNQDRDGLVVSIHFNAGGDGTKPIGTEVLYYDQKGLAERLAKAISDATGGGLKNRGAKQRKDLGVLAQTHEPAILIEVCFVNSSIDVAIYRRDFEKICQAIARELALAAGKSPSTSSTVEDKKEVKPVELLNDTGRNEIRELLKSAREAKIIGSVHTDERIAKYADIELLSYQAAVINRTFK